MSVIFKAGNTEIVVDEDKFNSPVCEEYLNWLVNEEYNEVEGPHYQVGDIGEDYFTAVDALGVSNELFFVKCK